MVPLVLLCKSLSYNSIYVHMLSSGRKAEEAKAEVNAQNAQTAAVLENPLRSPQLSSPAEDSPPKTRAAKLMEMRKLNLRSQRLSGTAFRFRYLCHACSFVCQDAKRQKRRPRCQQRRHS
eukprot:COSAG02_NODE_1147_length_14223_cov_4.760337_9_plen_120_part_00